VRRRAEITEAEELCARVGISPGLMKRRVSELSAVEQQMLEIAKALRLASTVLILDEPTAPLGHQEIGQLFTVVRNVARNGVGVILITHQRKVPMVLHLRPAVAAWALVLGLGLLLQGASAQQNALATPNKAAGWKPPMPGRTTMSIPSVPAATAHAVSTVRARNQ